MSRKILAGALALAAMSVAASASAFAADSAMSHSRNLRHHDQLGDGGSDGISSISDGFGTRLGGSSPVGHVDSGTQIISDGGTELATNLPDGGAIDGHLQSDHLRLGAIASAG